MDTATNANARGLLEKRLANFKDSNCWNVLGHEGIKVQNILDHYKDENFYDVRSGSQFANQTLSGIGIGSADQTTLSASLGGSDAVTVGVLGSAAATAVLVGNPILLFRQYGHNPPEFAASRDASRARRSYGFGNSRRQVFSPERLGKQ